MTVYDQITFFIKFPMFFLNVCFSDVLKMQKTSENIAQSAGNANSPRIRKVYVEGHTA